MPGYAVSGERWIKEGRITPQNPDGTKPTVTIDKPEGTFQGDSQEITLNYTDVDSGT
jgi:alpha-amylase